MFRNIQSVKRIVNGNGCIEAVGREAIQLGAKSVFIITDKGLTAFGLHDTLCASLRDAAIDYHLYDGVELEPGSESIWRCAEKIREYRADVIIGFGGGSALDSAKAAAVLLAEEGSIADFFGYDKVKSPCLPLILIPTFPGGGSEMTPIAVVRDDRTGERERIVSDHLYAEVVILDPELVSGLSPRSAAEAGVGAFIHAMESYVGNSATEVCDVFNLKAMKMIRDSLVELCNNGKSHKAGEQLLYGSAFAGLGFGENQNGIIYAIGESIPGQWKQPYNLLLAAIAPIGMEYNCLSRPEKFAVIGDILRGADRAGISVQERAMDSVMAFRELLGELQISIELKDYGITPRDLEGIVLRASNAERPIKNNPRDCCSLELRMLMENNLLMSAVHGRMVA